MLLLWFVLILAVKERWLAMCTLDIFATGKCVNRGGENGLEIPSNFHFYGPEKAIKMTKKLNKKDQRIKTEQRSNLSEILIQEMSYMGSTLDLSAIESSVLGSNVNWDVRYREVSAIRRL